ncbi:MAG: Mth938-like domain-containing protein [Gammaproteobacteria bacterium]|nr:Mth938-like domain-containing protein [Gammaproteobacteria bacterium]
MKLELDTAEEGYYRIRSYTAGAITINEETLTRSVVVTPRQLVREWPPQSFASLAPEHFDLIVTLEPEIILIGTGARLRFPQPDIIAPVTRRNIGIEFMDTGAACRSYNVLMVEGRRVAAALLMITG